MSRGRLLEWGGISLRRGDVRSWMERKEEGVGMEWKKTRTFQYQYYINSNSQ